jgi:hypothetical protein
MLCGIMNGLLSSHFLSFGAGVTRWFDVTVDLWGVNL